MIMIHHCCQHEAEELLLMILLNSRSFLLDYHEGPKLQLGNLQVKGQQGQSM